MSRINSKCCKNWMDKIVYTLSVFGVLLFHVQANARLVEDVLKDFESLPQKQEIAVQLNPFLTTRIVTKPPLIASVSHYLNLSKIILADTVFYFEYFGKRDFIKHFCPKECLCMAKVLSDYFQVKKYPHAILSLSGSETRSGVKILGSYNRYETFSYHYAVLLNAGGEWWVFDPILLGSSAELFEDWVKRLFESKDVSAFLIKP